MSTSLGEEVYYWRAGASDDVAGELKTAWIIKRGRKTVQIAMKDGEGWKYRWVKVDNIMRKEE